MTWLDADMQVGLVFLGIGVVVLLMLGGLVWAISRWGE